LFLNRPRFRKEVLKGLLLSKREYFIIGQGSAADMLAAIPAKIDELENKEESIKKGGTDE
jgi:hypothetical protein